MASLGPKLVSVKVKVIVPPKLDGLDAVLTILKSVCGLTKSVAAFDNKLVQTLFKTIIVERY